MYNLEYLVGLLEKTAKEIIQTQQNLGIIRLVKSFYQSEDPEFEKGLREKIKTWKELKKQMVPDKNILNENDFKKLVEFIKNRSINKPKDVVDYLKDKNFPVEIINNFKIQGLSRGMQGILEYISYSPEYSRMFKRVINQI